MAKHHSHTQPDLDGAIAVIGMAGRFPGADDVDRFWENISTGVESFTTFTTDELLAAGVDPALLARPEYVRSRPVLSDISSFDAGFFGLNPREATFADPQQRLFTECAWQAMEMAGYVDPETRGEVGVFAGTNISMYLFTRPKAMRMESVDLDAVMAGNDKDSLATTVSYRLDLRGPSVAVQSFCSTSLVAVHLACASLRAEECDMAIAGGVSVRLPDRVGYLFAEGGQASPDGHVRTFDADAKGSMFGDGVAVVALKRLDRAIADRDSVLAVIRGSAINNDGSLKFSYHAPSIDGQRRCISAAIAASGVEPSQISYVEAHGTATEVGDPMEVAALTSAYGTTAENHRCLIGSVKPNVGHLDRASGVTGLIKVIQSMRHELIPGTRNFVTPNPEIDFAAGPFQVTAAPTPWPRTPGSLRVAGVNSLGMGGTNVHAIVTEAPQPADRKADRRRWQVLPISTRWADGTQRALSDLAGALSQQGDLDLADVAYTLQAGRRAFNHRAVVVADSTESAAAAFSTPATVPCRMEKTIGRGVTFLIAGVGEHGPGMLAENYDNSPEFRADVDECVSRLGLGGVDELTDIFSQVTRPTTDLAALMGRADPGTAPPADARWAQPAAFVAGWSVARQLIRWGVAPSLLAGYSVGEYVAACLAGVLTLPDALALVGHRAELISQLPTGSMLAVAGDIDVLDQLPVELRCELDLSVNAGSQVVVGGPDALIDLAAAALREKGIGCRTLATSHAYHSRTLTPAAAPLTRWIAENITLSAPRIDYLSNVTGQVATAELVTDPGYWAEHMCRTVDFDGVLTHALGLITAMVEIGPGQSLGALARAHRTATRDQWPLIIAALPGANDQRTAEQTLTEAIGRLWLTGVTIDWRALHGERQPGRIPLPTYPFQRETHWLDADRVSIGGPVADDLPTLPDEVPLLPESDWLHQPLWSQTPLTPPAEAAGNWLILSAPGVAEAVQNRLIARLPATAKVIIGHPGTAFVAGERHLQLRPGSPEDAAAAMAHLQRIDAAPDRIVHLWTLPPEHGGVRSVNEQVELGLQTLVALARGAGDLGLAAYTVDVVTAGSQRVHPGDRVDAGAMTALGPCRLIPVEYPGTSARLIDVDPRRAVDAVTEIVAAPTDQLVGLRGGHRYLPSHASLDPATDPVSGIGFRDGGTYLVTGGLGGIGLAMAERIATDHRANLILLGRTPAPEQMSWSAIAADESAPAEVRRRVAGLQRIVDAGSAILNVSGDVADPADVDRAVAIAESEFGALHGIVHCAGVPAVGLMQFKSPSDIAGVLAPKVNGTLALADAAFRCGAEFLVLFSSTTADTGGGAGQVDYCAANAFLDAFAQSEPVPGCRVVSIGWGEWTWNGWTTGLDKYDEGSKNYFETYRRTFGIDFDHGWRTMKRALAIGEPHVVVSTQPFPLLVAMSRRSSIASHQQAVRQARDADGRHQRPELSTPFVEPITPEEIAVAGVWAEALGLESVGANDNFFELGGNSLVGMEIIASVRTALGIPHLPPHLLYQAPTVTLLAVTATTSAEAGADDTASRSVSHHQRIEQRRKSLRTRRPA